MLWCSTSGYSSLKDITSTCNYVAGLHAHLSLPCVLTIPSRKKTNKALHERAVDLEWIKGILSRQVDDVSCLCISLLKSPYTSIKQSCPFLHLSRGKKSHSVLIHCSDFTLGMKESLVVGGFMKLPSPAQPLREQMSVQLSASSPHQPFNDDGSCCQRTATVINTLLNNTGCPSY